MSFIKFLKVAYHIQIIEVSHYLCGYDKCCRWGWANMYSNNGGYIESLWSLKLWTSRIARLRSSILKKSWSIWIRYYNCLIEIARISISYILISGYVFNQLAGIDESCILMDVIKLVIVLNLLDSCCWDVSSNGMSEVTTFTINWCRSTGSGNIPLKKVEQRVNP